jgi:spermidine/putrescine ABC transporter ATP-binding subunit
MNAVTDAARQQSEPPQGGASVYLESISKKYGSFYAVQDVSLDIPPGKFVTILGPSGSGKTTLLMLIAGFVWPSAGEIFIDHRPVSTLPPQSRNLGIVFQSYALFPHMTVAQNISFPLEMRRLPRAAADQRIRRILEVVQLEGYAHRYPRQLSGGQQQRVALARAAVFEPRVMLMDEPLGALDRKLRQQMQLELKNIQRRLNVTVVYVTHDQEEAVNLSDVIAVLRRGRIEQVGNPQEVYDNPANVFVADFVGESNIFEGAIRSIDEDGLVEVLHSTGTVFRAVGEGQLQVGDRVQASVRPEHIRIGPVAETGPWNTCRGRLVDVFERGASMRWNVAVGEVLVTADTRRNERRLSPEIGAVVDLIWEPKHTKLHRDQGGG